MRWHFLILLGLGLVFATQVQGQNLKAAAVKNKKFKDCAECPDMVVVPAGSFMMGSPEGETKRVKEHEDQAPVRIAKPFAVGIFAVTRGEYAGRD